MPNPTVAQKVPFTITPKDQNGNIVDLVANPAALTGISFSCDNGPDAVVVADATDPKTAWLTRASPGVVNVVCQGVNVLGATVSDAVQITFDAVAPPAVVVTTLNLAAGEAVAK